MHPNEEVAAESESESESESEDDQSAEGAALFDSAQSSLHAAVIAAAHQHPFVGSSSPSLSSSSSSAVGAAVMGAAAAAAMNLSPLAHLPFLAPSPRSLFPSQSPQPPSPYSHPPPLDAREAGPEMVGALSSVAAPFLLSPALLVHWYFANYSASAVRSLVANSPSVASESADMPSVPVVPTDSSAPRASVAVNNYPSQSPSSTPEATTETAEQTTRTKIKWTQLMDGLVLEGVERYKRNKIGLWKKVAQYVSAHLQLENPSEEEIEKCVLLVTNHQCGERYKHHLSPEAKSRKTGPWTDEELEQLAKLVAEQEERIAKADDDGSTSTRKSSINWVRISELLNRNYRDCQYKWTTLQSQSATKRGPFSFEEEALILATVEENGENTDTWTLLEERLGRKRRSIQDKFTYLKRRKI